MPSLEVANKILEHMETKKRPIMVKQLKQVGFGHGHSYKLVDRYLKDNTLFDQRKFNRRPKKLTQKQLVNLKKKVNNTDNHSLRKLENELEIPRESIRRNLRSMGIKHYKKRRGPKYKKKNEKEIKIATGRLYRLHLTGKQPLPTIVMDDETYITENDLVKYGSQGYYTDSKNTIPDNMRVLPATKFPFKVGIWYAISDFGVSDYFIWTNSMAINQNNYRTECLEKILIPFIEKSGIKDQCLFWPDKASAHYAKSVVSYLRSEQIALVPKKDNPSNLPQCRPIERAHSILKDHIFKDNFVPQNVEELKQRVVEIMENRETILQSIWTNFSKRVRKLTDQTRRDGLYKTHH